MADKIEIKKTYEWKYDAPRYWTIKLEGFSMAVTANINPKAVLSFDIQVKRDGGSSITKGGYETLLDAQKACIDALKIHLITQIPKVEILSVI